MQRLFSMFPDGLPGVALGLLRASVAFTVLVHGFTSHGALRMWLLVAVIALSILLVAGILTPILALVAIAVQWTGLPDITFVDVVIVAAASLNALALALLGPGAYSLDARRFGRRVVDLPSEEA
jgi:hypothetical protein